jgi:hypothetical protein
MSLGISPLGTSAIGAADETPAAPPRKTLVTARKIEAETMRYVANDDGGFEAMPASAQRVLLALASVVEPKIIDIRFEATMDARIRSELAFLTKRPEPAIEIIRIEVSNDGRHGTTKKVVFRDLKSGKMATVER